MSKILLLEPSAPLGGTYNSALEFAGHEVAWCTDAQEAIMKVDEDTPDLIIAELQLALHNGIEFLYELRSYKEWQNIPVLILSGVPAVEKQVLNTLWSHLNITGYHYKPLTKLHELLRSIEQILAPAEPTPDLKSVKRNVY